MYEGKEIDGYQNNSSELTEEYSADRGQVPEGDEVRKNFQKYKWKHVGKLEIYEDNPASYAYGTSLYKLCWLFVLGSLTGYLAETVWYYYLRGHLVNRQGVLFGPFSPIYGVGFVMLTLLLYKWRRKDWSRIWLVSMIVLSSFEYLCSYMMEKVLGTRAWNYSRQSFNLNGRICLKFCIMWGFFGVLFIKVLYPLFSRTIENIRPAIGKTLGIALAVFLLMDCLFSVKVSLRQSERRMGVPPGGALEAWMDSYYTDEKLAEIYTEIRVVPPKVR